MFDSVRQLNSQGKITEIMKSHTPTLDKAFGLVFALYFKLTSRCIVPDSAIATPAHAPPKRSCHWLPFVIAIGRRHVDKGKTPLRDKKRGRERDGKAESAVQESACDNEWHTYFNKERERERVRESFNLLKFYFRKLTRQFCTDCTHYNSAIKPTKFWASNYYSIFCGYLTKRSPPPLALLTVQMCTKRMLIIYAKCRGLF